MLLGAGVSDPDHVNGRAGLGTLAAQSAAALRQRGIDRIGSSTTTRCSASSVTPPASRRTTPTTCITRQSPPWRSTADATGTAIRRTIPTCTPGMPNCRRSPAADAAATFATRLAENGIAVDGEVTSGAAPQGQSPLTSVSSAQLNEIMAFMMRHSDNTLAEEFGRLTALAAGRENSPHGATQAVAATLQELGVDTAQLTMADCSGLAPGSSLSVRTLIGRAVPDTGRGRRLGGGGGAFGARTDRHGRRPAR